MQKTAPKSANGGESKIKSADNGDKGKGGSSKGTNSHLQLQKGKQVLMIETKGKVKVQGRVVLQKWPLQPERSKYIAISYQGHG